MGSLWLMANEENTFLKNVKSFCLNPSVCTHVSSFGFTTPVQLCCVFVHPSYSNEHNSPRTSEEFLQFSVIDKEITFYFQKIKKYPNDTFSGQKQKFTFGHISSVPLPK